MLFLLGLFLALPGVGPLAAQAEPAQWGTQVNLSRSGATSDPQLVVDNSGRYHVLWLDEFDGLRYTSGDGTNWSQPVTPELPFATRRIFTELPETSPFPTFNPTLVADNGGNIHAFWINNVSDPAGVLFHSFVPAGQFANYDAWSPAEALETGAIAPASAVDNSGRLHLTYIHTTDDNNRPAGIYYRRAFSGQGSWSGPTAIYTSAYLRTTSSDDANVEIAVGDAQQVMIAWNDTDREQLFVSRSANGGQSWETPVLVDQRLATDAADASGPRHIRLGSTSGSTVVVWQATHGTEQLCTQYYRATNDGGQTWSDAQSLEERFPGCWDDSSFVTVGEAVLLFVETNSGTGVAQADQLTHVMAWDGTQWSLPQEQRAISQFLNPETNQVVRLQCLDPESHAQELVVVGCDSHIGGDIWWASRPIGSLEGWFPPPPIWQGPERVGELEGLPGTAHVVGGEPNRATLLAHLQDGDTFFLSQWQNGVWQPATAVLSVPSAGIVSHAAVSHNGRLQLVWHDSDGLKFAQASSDRPNEWSTPVLVADAAVGGQLPGILATRDGDLLIFFSVAVNEPRGVYMVRSADQGASWSDPVRIFDGAAAGWEAVGQSHLVETGSGRLHLAVEQMSLPPGSQALGMVDQYSDDGGLSWSAAQPLENGGQPPAIWASLHSWGEQTLHMVWASGSVDRTFIWHQTSVDGGEIWSEAVQVNSLPVGELPAATVDPGGQLHVIGLDSGRLQHWSLNGTGWVANESRETNLMTGRLDVAAIVPGNLIAGHLGQPAISDEVGPITRLTGLSRPLDLSEVSLPSPNETAPPVPPGVPTAVAQDLAPAAEPTPTIVIPTAVDQGNGFLNSLVSASGPLGPLGIAVIPAALVIGVVVAVALRAVRLGGRGK